MPVTMADIDMRRAAVGLLLDLKRACELGHPDFAPCARCEPLREKIDDIRNDIEVMLILWWSQGCKEVA